MILSRIHGRPAQGGDRAGSPGKVTPAVPDVQSSSKLRSVGAGQSLRASPRTSAPSAATWKSARPWLRSR